MNNTTLHQYALSNSDSTVRFERNIQHTPLGTAFDEALRQQMGLDVVASYFDARDDFLFLDLKLRVEKSGDYGTLERYIENDITQIKNDFCRRVWEIFCRCVEQIGLPALKGYEADGVWHPYRLRIETYDFEKRSRVGYFMNELPALQANMRERFPRASFTVRYGIDDIRLYYLIFDDKAQRKLAEELYGIDAMIDHALEICKSDDPYKVFEKFRPDPIITDKETLRQQGEVMGVMRNNTQFKTF